MAHGSDQVLEPEHKERTTPDKKCSCRKADGFCCVQVGFLGAESGKMKYNLMRLLVWSGALSNRKGTMHAVSVSQEETHTSAASPADTQRYCDPLSCCYPETPLHVLRTVLRPAHRWSAACSLSEKWCFKLFTDPTILHSHKHTYSHTQKKFKCLMSPSSYSLSQQMTREQNKCSDNAALQQCPRGQFSLWAQHAHSKVTTNQKFQLMSLKKKK